MEQSFWNTFHYQCAAVAFDYNNKYLLQTMAKIKCMLFLTVDLPKKLKTTNIFKIFWTWRVHGWNRNICRGCPIFYQCLIQSFWSRQYCSFLLPLECFFSLMILMGNFYRPLVVQHNLLHPDITQWSQSIPQILKLMQPEGALVSALFQMHFHRLTSDLGYTSINSQ